MSFSFYRKKRHFSLLEKVREFYYSSLCLSQQLEQESLIQSVTLLSALKEIISNKYLLQIKANKFRKERCSLLTSLMSCLSSHLSTSGPSSVSALYTASLAIRMAAASWSKDAAIFWIWVWASAQLKIRKSKEMLLNYYIHHKIVGYHTNLNLKGIVNYSKISKFQYYLKKLALKKINNSKLQYSSHCFSEKYTQT